MPQALKKYSVTCVHRVTGEPYQVLVEAANADAAKLIASENHIAGAAIEYAHPTPNDTAVLLLAEVRELSLSVKALDAKMPDQATLRASIRGGVFRAMVQWALFVFLVLILFSIFIGLIDSRH